MSFQVGFNLSGKVVPVLLYVRLGFPVAIQRLLLCVSGTDQAPPVQLIQYFIPESVLLLEDRMLEAEVLEAIKRTDARTNTGLHNYSCEDIALTHIHCVKPNP